MWNPTEYLTFADERGRPYGELLSRIDVRTPRRIVDLGCGPGNLTVGLRERWPDAAIEATDNSPEMVAAARERGLDARLESIDEFVPSADTDVVISNAALQWVPEHRDLLRQWTAAMPAGSVIAFQVPGNFDAPSHRTIRALAGTDRWRSALPGVTLRGAETTEDPTGYADLLTEAGCTVDAWETTYVQALTGEDPVLEWVTGTALTPVREVATPEQWADFRAELAPLLRTEYPRRTDGITWFPFRRVFVVATVS